MKITTKILGSVLLLTMSSMLILTSCDGNDPDPGPDPTDFTALEAKITEAETLISSTSEGTADGQFQRGSQAILQTAIDLAKGIATNSEAQQLVVDNTIIALDAAIAVYNESVITPIDPENLVGHWIFNEGTGTTVADFSGNAFNGTFNTGHAEHGSGEATWATDRYGNEGNAVAFGEGAWIEVPYNSALNPTAITVSLWVKATELPGGRFMGLQSWLGYKFEVPDHGKPFFTASTEGKIWDNDSGTPIVAGEWYHLAVTYAAGEMAFYIDGTEVKREENAESNDMVAVTGHNLAIGRDSSKYADTDGNYGDEAHADYHIIPVAWSSYFTGSLDELRIYKTALTASQVQTIYEVEKPD